MTFNTSKALFYLFTLSLLCSHSRSIIKLIFQIPIILIRPQPGELTP